MMGALFLKILNMSITATYILIATFILCLLIRRVKNVLNYRKPSFWVLMITVAVIVIAAVCLLKNPVIALKLPDPSDVLYIEIEQVDNQISNGATRVIDKKDIDSVLIELSGARKTFQQSVNDYPTKNDYLIIRLIQDDEMRTLCLYNDWNGYYIEEPYIGVYKCRNDEVGIEAIYETYN